MEQELLTFPRFSVGCDPFIYLFRSLYLFWSLYICSLVSDYQLCVFKMFFLNDDLRLTAL